MEIGEQRAHYPKVKSGIDEDVSLAGSGLNPAGFASCVFQSSHRRGPYGHDSPMAPDEIEAKFRGNASLVMSDDGASRVIRNVRTLGAEPSLEKLMRSLTL